MTNQGSVYEEFKSKLCLGSSYYVSVQGFCLCMLSKHVNIKIYETIMLLVVTLVILSLSGIPNFFKAVSSSTHMLH
jgi:hypothetical protein